jgi:chitodextrinase
VFNAGDKATYQGHLYQALYYTRNQAPGAAKGPWKQIS